MKKRVLAASILAMGMVFGANVYGGDVKLVVDGEDITSTAAPEIMDGRTMVPMRVIFEKLGATIDWDADTKTVTGKKDGKKVVLQVGSDRMQIGNKYMSLEVAPVIVGGRTLVPARAVSESLDCDVKWNANTRTVVITTNTAEEVVEEVEENVNPALVNHVKKDLAAATDSYNLGSVARAARIKKEYLEDTIMTAWKRFAKSDKDREYLYAMHTAYDKFIVYAAGIDECYSKISSSPALTEEVCRNAKQNIANIYEEIKMTESVEKINECLSRADKEYNDLKSKA